MAQDNKREGRCLNPGQVEYHFKLIFGTTSISSVSGAGGGAVPAVTRTGVGAYTITLDRGFTKLWDFNVDLQRSAGAHYIGRILTDYVPGATTLSFVICDTTGTNQDPANGDFGCVNLLFDELGIIP